jgi:integrase
VLRRILNLAVEWSALDSAPKIKILPGERRRERVIAPEEEARYLAAAPEPLASIATVLADTGMRPEECFRLGWEHVTWLNGRNGALLVTHGKTAAARRVIPTTPRVRAVLESRWSSAGTLARIAGHNSIGISARYVHPSEDAVQDAISRLGGHKIGHRQ